MKANTCLILGCFLATTINLLAQLPPVIRQKYSADLMLGLYVPITKSLNLDSAFNANKPAFLPDTALKYSGFASVLVPPIRVQFCFNLPNRMEFGLAAQFSQFVVNEYALDEQINQIVYQNKYHFTSWQAVAFVGYTWFDAPKMQLSSALGGGYAQLHNVYNTQLISQAFTVDISFFKLKYLMCCGWSLSASLRTAINPKDFHFEDQTGGGMLAIGVGYSFGGYPEIRSKK